MTLKPGTNLGELNHLPTDVWSFGIAKLWAGRIPALARHGAAPHRYSPGPPESVKTRELQLQAGARRILIEELY